MFTFTKRKDLNLSDDERILEIEIRTLQESPLNFRITKALSIVAHCRKRFFSSKFILKTLFAFTMRTKICFIFYAAGFGGFDLLIC